MDDLSSPNDRRDSTATGYLHAAYAASLSEFGTPYALPLCDGWILQRRISGTSNRDAMGSYPLFSCNQWPRLHADLEALQATDLVSLALTTDPFGAYDEHYLHLCFPDLVLPFKKHFVVDLNQDPEAFVSKHHHRNARKALQKVDVEPCQASAGALRDWIRLYGMLIRRHQIQGISAFSPAAFKKQFQVPGLMIFRAVHGTTTVGMTLWYVQQNVAYYHLAAYEEVGYDLRASFGLFWHAIGYFTAAGVRWLNLGAGAGTGGDTQDGLTRFKAGWATGTRTAYLCGRIFDKQQYWNLAAERGLQDARYFPAYRKGEFT